MTPPKASDIGTLAETSEIASAVLLCADDTAAEGSVPNAAWSDTIEILKNRPDFLRAASARRQSTAGFLVQARHRGDASPMIRVGFTASKKIGNAVARNRAKRRLRAVMRAILPELGQSGWDYVLVAKPQATIARDFAALLTDLSGALRILHKI